MSAQPEHHVATVAPGQIIADASAWRGKDFPDDRSWVRALSQPMIEEILARARAARARGIDPKQMRPEDFPLDHARSLVDAAYRDVECGPGFALVSGFPHEGLDRTLLELAYCGLCAHFGAITVQNREGEYLLEVTDKGKTYDSQMRGYHSTAHLDFHNDGTNTVTLLCLETAAEGGLSMLVSGAEVYNTIVRERPEYLPVVHRGFHHHRRNQRTAGDAAVTPYRTPVFGFYNGVFHMAYAGPSMLYCEAEGIVISDEEKAVLAYLVAVIERPDMRVSMELRKGDLQFVNNYNVLHARTEYRDSETRRRKLLRLWLDDERSARLGPGKMDWYLAEYSRFTRQVGTETLEHA